MQKYLKVLKFAVLIWNSYQQGVYLTECIWKCFMVVRCGAAAGSLCNRRQHCLSTTHAYTHTHTSLDINLKTRYSLVPYSVRLFVPILRQSFFHKTSNYEQSNDLSGYIQNLPRYERDTSFNITCHSARNTWHNHPNICWHTGCLIFQVESLFIPLTIRVCNTAIHGPLLFANCFECKRQHKVNLLQDWVVCCFAILMAEAADTFETSVPTYQITQRHAQADRAVCVVSTASYSLLTQNTTS
jgi:hypothetical protein